MSEMAMESTGAVEGGGGDLGSESVSGGERVSTNAVAASVLNDLEASAGEVGGEDEGAEAVSEPTEPEPAQAAASEPTKEELSEEEQLLHEFGFKDARRPDGREHYIARSKVLKMIGSGLKRGQARWEGEKTALSSQMEALKADLDEVRADILGDPLAFAQKVAPYNPKFQAFLQQQTATTTAPAAITEMPQPDVPLADGSRTYSVEGIQKLIEWAIDAKAMPKVDERLKPLTEREQQSKAESQVRERAQQQLREAEAWPNWADYKDDVQKTLMEDTQKARAAGRRPSMTLREAYLDVRARKLDEKLAVASETDAQRRVRLLKEVSQAAKATPAIGRTADGVPKVAAQVANTRDIAAQTYAELERGR